MSEIRATTISDAAGTGPITLTSQVASKAWCCYDGTGTAAITESFNFSSITDSGSGIHSVSLTNNMSSSTYSVVGSTGESNTGGIVRVGGAAAGNISLNTRECSSASLYDDSRVRLNINGDLA